MSDGHREAEEIAMAVHLAESKKLLAEFDKFLDNVRNKYFVILPEYRIAAYCLMLENKRSNRADVLSIRSVPKDALKVALKSEIVATYVADESKRHNSRLTCLLCGKEVLVTKICSFSVISNHRIVDTIEHGDVCEQCCKERGW
jgi:hypothetical protein